MVSKLSIQTCSPIHVLSPTVNFQGYFMETPGLMTTLSPILAPNTRNNRTRNPEKGNQELFNIMTLIKYQTPHFSLEPGLYQALVY